ncbi:MAG: hypothetical protein IPN77_19240 [Sandaracinaceae bacterium]|nr:hypothetical protein [Sandaracinaceae bacterium]
MEFLAPRVPINYSAKLVMYLRDVGFLTDDEAERVLEAAGPRNIRRRSSDPSLLRDVGLLNAALLLGVLGGGAAIQAGSASGDGDPAPHAARQQQRCSAERRHPRGGGPVGRGLRGR